MSQAIPFHDLVGAVCDLPAFAAMLPHVTCPPTELLGRIVAAWIDPGAIDSVIGRYPCADLQGRVEFDLGFTRPVPATSQAVELVFVELLQELAEGLTLPIAALTLLAKSGAAGIPPDVLCRSPRIEFKAVHLSPADRSSPEHFVRIRTSALARELLQRPLLMICNEFTESVARLAETSDHRGSTFFENHAINIFDAYLQATLSQLSGSPSRAGICPGDGLSMSLNLQFTRDIIVMGRLPLSSDDIRALRITSYEFVARQWEPE